MKKVNLEPEQLMKMEIPNCASCYEPMELVNTEGEQLSGYHSLLRLGAPEGWYCPKCKYVFVPGIGNPKALVKTTWRGDIHE